MRDPNNLEGYTPDTTEIERQRQRYSPFTKVILTSEQNGVTECIYIGHITKASVVRMWTDPETGETFPRCYEVIDRVETPQPMALEDIVDWIKSGPDELCDKLDNDLPNDIGNKIGIAEWYPSENEDL